MDRPFEPALFSEKSRELWSLPANVTSTASGLFLKKKKKTKEVNENSNSSLQAVKERRLISNALFLTSSCT